MVDTGRSHRIGTTGNLQRSMRANYDEYGVDSVCIFRSFRSDQLTCEGIVLQKGGPQSITEGHVGSHPSIYQVGATYRNPHLPGVCACMFTWLDR